MKAIAGGATTAAQVGGLLGKTKEELEPIVDRLVAMGYVDERVNLFPPFTYVLRLRDPVIRFHYAVVEPALQLLRGNSGGPLEAWRGMAAQFRSQVVGPAFEDVVAHSAMRMLYNRDIKIGNNGWTVVHDPQTAKNHEVDLVGLEPFASALNKKSPVVVIGEAKATRRPRELKDLQRLRRIRELLAKERPADDAKLVLFSLYGFSDALLEEAADRSDEVVLFGLDDLFEWKD
ncbi:hypothetical protein [Microbispora sp. NPDC049125]|uniref:hypothetical protein n=1 Tax=Microbispora sp. NPDC049125 TaxID=3154929 RepID=UPI003464EC8D